ncbi:MAG: hypothetical protein IJW81_09435, partial [Clostridia bacterium]|nr:hypothetical protein [Clostridia bacterium]
MYAVLFAGDDAVADDNVLECADMDAELGGFEIGNPDVVEEQVADVVERHLTAQSGDGGVSGDVVDKDGNILAHDGDMLDLAQATAIVNAGIEQVHVRTILKCKCKHGVCAHCYGADLATSKKVSVGEAVGIIAAQSIGEPG